VAGLALVPVAALARRRGWTPFVLGGSLAVLLVVLVPPIFTPFADVVSLSQARRAAGFIPVAFAFVGGIAVAARLLRLAALPIALVAGLALQSKWPGDFGYRLEQGGPPLAAWIAAFGGAAALALAVPAARRLDVERQGPVALAAACLFVVPVAIHGVREWGPRETRGSSLTPGLVQALRSEVPEGAVVFSDVETSYRIAAYAPVYVAAAPTGHVADTAANRPYERWRDSRRFLRTGNLAIPRRYGARWIVLDRLRFRLRLDLPVAYRDGRYTLYRLR
jgi:hypothetical protein